MPLSTTRRPEADVPPLTPRTSRVLTAVLALSAAAFVVLTVGSSLVGSTSFYGGGNLVNHKPWAASEHLEPIEVTNHYVGDTIDFFIPGRSQIVERVYSGDIPGWNPLQGAGSELGTVPTYGLLAPTGWAWWIVPPSLAPGWEKLTVLVLATAGTALFLRRLGVRRHAAWLGGMIYAASGFMIAWTNWPQAGVAAMLPWLLWSTERALQLRTWRSVVPVALSVGFLLLGGFPAVTGLGLYAAGGYALLRLLTRDAAPGRRVRTALADIGRLSAGLVVGFLLAGLQLAAFVYAFLDLDTGYREGAFNRVVPLRMVLTAVFPNAWGTRGGGPFYTGTNPIEANAYIGAAALVLCVVALLVRPGREVPRGARGYFVGVVVVGGLLIYVQGPLLQWVGALPVFSGNPIGRLVSVVLLAAAVLAGLGFDAALRGAGTRSRWTALRLLAGLAVTVAAVGLLARWIHEQVVDRLAAEQQSFLPLAVVAAGLTAVAVVLAHLLPSWRGLVLAVVPVVVVVQGVTAATPMWAQVDREAFYPTTPAHEFLLRNQGSDRIAVTGSPMVNGTTAYYGLRSATGHVFSSPEFGRLQRAVCRPCRLSATYWVLPGPTDLDLWQSPGLDRMGVRYLTTDPESVIPGAEEVVVAGSGERPVPTTGEQPLEVTIPGGPLRGVRLDFRSGPAELSSGHLVAEVVDDDGDVVATTRRLIQFARPAVPLYVPLAGEDLPAGGTYTVRLSWDGPTEAPLLGADDAGRPNVAVIRPADDGLRLAYSGGVAVWERLDALPRVRWAATTEVIGSARDRVEALTEPGLPPDTVVLDRAGEPTDGAPADVEVLQDAGDVVRVRVDADGAGYLVLAEDVQSDWTATVDGEEVPIVAADHAFGAVRLPEGVSEVTFSYTPRGGTAGLVATGTGLLLLLLMAVPAAWWRRRRPHAPEGDGDEHAPAAARASSPAPVG